MDQLFLLSPAWISINSNINYQQSFWEWLSGSDNLLPESTGCTGHVCMS